MLLKKGETAGEDFLVLQRALSILITSSKKKDILIMCKGVSRSTVKLPNSEGTSTVKCMRLKKEKLDRLQ